MEVDEGEESGEEQGIETQAPTPKQAGEGYTDDEGEAASLSEARKTGRKGKGKEGKGSGKKNNKIKSNKKETFCLRSLRKMGPRPHHVLVQGCTKQLLAGLSRKLAAIPSRRRRWG